MNDEDNEELRQDISRLANDMNELYQRVKLLEQKYRWNTNNTLHNLAGQLFRQTGQEYSTLYRKVCEMDLIFSD